VRGCRAREERVQAERERERERERRGARAKQRENQTWHTLAYTGIHEGYTRGE